MQFLFLQDGYTGSGSDYDTSLFDHSGYSIMSAYYGDYYFRTYTNNLNKVDLYTITIHIGYQGFDYKTSVEFTINVRDPCIDASMTISPSILTSTTIDYYTYKPADVQTLSTSYVSSTESSSACPSIILEVIMTDETEIDLEVFTFDPALLTFTTETSDLEKIAEYEFTLTAKYTILYNDIKGTLDFTVTISDPCALASFIVQSAIIPSYTAYNIGTPQLDYFFSPLYVESSEAICPDYYFTVES